MLSCQTTSVYETIEDMDTITVILCVLLLPSLYFLKYFRDWKKLAEVVNKIPGPKTFPFVGTTWHLVGVSREDLFALVNVVAEQYRPVYRTWMGSQPEVHLLSPEDIEVVLSSQKLLDKSNIYNFLHPWLGKGLLTNTGTSWHSRRKLLTPAFHFSILENFINVFVEKAEFLVNRRLCKLEGKEFDICPEITKCALDVICKTAMGVDVNAMSDANNDYVTAVYEMSEITTKRILSLWLYPDSIFYNLNYGKRYKRCLEIVHGFTSKIIKERKEVFQQEQLNQNSKNDEEDILMGKKKRMAFLDLILEASLNGTKLTDFDIREEVDTFMFEGHDTTTASICFTLFMLGNNLDVQEKVAEELDGIFGDDDRSVTMKDLSQMKYLERVIKESLRLYPSVPFIFRKNKEPIRIGKYDIPAGTTLAIHIYHMHRNPDIYPDPSKFDPDRFLPEACKERHPFAYIPFSAGPRNCIGQKFALLEEKTILASIIRKYRIKAIESPDKMQFYPELILKGQKGINVIINPR